MPFTLPQYQPPDFNSPHLSNAPVVNFELVETAGVAPNEYHGTSVYPEYYHLIKGEWRLAGESRMDCVVVRGSDDQLRVTEFRNLKLGDLVAVGRRENGEDGIYVHTNAFNFPDCVKEKCACRSLVTRETSFASV